MFASAVLDAIGESCRFVGVEGLRALREERRVPPWRQPPQVGIHDSGPIRRLELDDFGLLHLVVVTHGADHNNQTAKKPGVRHESQPRHALRGVMTWWRRSNQIDPTATRGSQPQRAARARQLRCAHARTRRARKPWRKRLAGQQASRPSLASGLASSPYIQRAHKNNTDKERGQS